MRTLARNALRTCISPQQIYGVVRYPENSYFGIFSRQPIGSPYGSLCIRGLRRIRSPPVSVNNHNADLDLVGSLDVRDKESFKLIMSPDADLAGDFETTKSTSGLWIELQSADGKRCWPIAWRSNRQSSTASSTCEAETISMATALKSEALPLLELFSEAMNRRVMLECREDNTQCISAVGTGYSDCRGRRQRDVCF